jgi:hypothetical protein
VVFTEELYLRQYASRFLKIVAWFLLGFPMSYLVIAAIGFDISFDGCGKILLSPFYYLLSGFAIVTGYGLQEMRRWSWYCFIVVQCLIGYQNAWAVHHYAESHHRFLIFIFSFLFQTVLVFRVNQEMRVPYLFPKIRWWESNPRYRLAVPVTVTQKNGAVLDAEILDLSVLGCFIKIRHDFSQDESVHLQFRAYDYALACEAKVLWCAQSTVTHPKGIGVKFFFLSRPQKRMLRCISRILKKISQLYRSSRYLMSQEEFLKALIQLESGNFLRKSKLSILPKSDYGH